MALPDYVFPGFKFLSNKKVKSETIVLKLYLTKTKKISVTYNENFYESSSQVRNLEIKIVSQGCFNRCKNLVK